MKIINKKKFYMLSLLFIFGLFIIPLIINFLFLPNKIKVIKGNTHKINLNIPAIATVISQDETILNVNNIPVENNDNINLNKPIYITPLKEGSVDMKISMMGIPIKNLTVSILDDTKLIPCGDTIGVRIDTQGVMVLGISSFLGYDGKEYEPAKNILKSGDMILKVNGENIENKETLIKSIQKNNILNIEIKRKNEIQNVTLNSVKGEDNKNKIGVWVRDSTQGIGTLTYINPKDNSFASLGHSIVDVDTKEIMEVKNGKIMHSSIIDVKKGEKGKPGELVGKIEKDEVLGNVTNNTSVGIYGTITNDNFYKHKKQLPIGLKDSVEVGKASILCNISGEEVKEYEIEIESINKYNIDNSKSMVIKITDKELLDKTNGIIQGMSGSPIIQNNKLIGAVTHVFVNEPSKGYGIFIENMLNN